MKIVVKVRFNATKERFEQYDGNRYIAYMSFPEDEDSDTIVNTRNILIGMISKIMGVPVNRIEFNGKDFMSNWIFEVG